MIAILLRVAHAQGPPPDVTRGDRFDGRKPVPRPGERLLAIPRLLLLPLRVLWRGVFLPTRWVVEWGEKHQVPRRVMAAITWRDGRIGIRPSVTYTFSFSPTVGVSYFDERMLGPETRVDATVLAGDGVFASSVHLRPTHALRALEADLDLGYEHREDRLFNGIGMDVAHAVGGSRYRVDGGDLRGKLTLRPHYAVRATFGAHLGIRRFGDGLHVDPDRPITQVYCQREPSGLCIPGSVDEGLVPGFHQGTQFARASADLLVDTRDSSFRPSSGAIVHAGASYSHGLGGGDSSSYLRIHAGLEAAIDLWQRSRVLIVRLQSEAVVPVGNGLVPFSELAVLGGPDDLRGARLGRYRDFTSVLATLEYRWPVWMWMDASLFVDYGGVFGRGYAGFAVDKLVPALGGGVRVRTAAQFFLRSQLAYGWGEGLQFFFGASLEP